MRFMALESFFYNSQYHEASPQAPKIFDFPDDETPNLRWRPLDKKARKALEDTAAKVQDDSGNIIAIYPIPEEFQNALVEATPIEKSPDVDPNRLPEATVAAVVPKTVVAKVGKGRASDQEPT
jgi:hypothetical protein